MSGHRVAGFAPEVPANAPLVVRCKGGTKALYVMVLVCVVVEVLLVAGLVTMSIALASPWPLVVAPLIVIQLLLMGIVLREYQGLLGPQLAADPSGLWVRTGLGRRPEVVYLPWGAIDGIEATRKGPVVRIVSPAGDALFPRRAHWRVRSLRRRFGTPFVVDGRRSAEHPAQLADRLRYAAAAHS
jgi:hypothetical protein